MYLREVKAMFIILTKIFRKDAVLFLLIAGLVASCQPTTELLKSFQKRDAPLNRVDAMHDAAEDGDVTALVALLDGGVDPNAFDQGHTPLHHAAENGHAEVIDALLDAGADPNVRDKASGKTAFDLIDTENEAYGTSAWVRLSDARFN
jgi:ankyrin repeat protein